MPGLLDTFFGTPEQTQALGLLGAGLAQRNAPGGFAAAMQYMGGAPERALKQKYMQAQADNLLSEVEARKAAIEKAKKDEDFFQSVFGPKPTQMGQLGSGSFGIMPTAPGVPSIPQGGGQGGGAIVPNLSFDQLAALKRRGLDLTDLHKYANDPRKLEAGSTYENRVTGQREYFPKLPEGASMTGGRVAPAPGYLDMLTQTTLAQEAPKTLLGAAGRLNMRPNADGTQTPVSELTENPTLQNVLNGVFGQRQPVAPARPMTAPPVLSQPRSQPAVPAQPGMTGSFIGNPDEVAMRIGSISDPQERANAQAAFEEQMRRSGGQLPRYGKTTNQEIADAAAKERAVKQAGADIVPAEQRQNDVAGGRYMLSVIDQAINHPGRETSTGLSGTLDPRNYLPGTEAKGFHSLLDQIRGGTFMQAYQSLKGGGQITEVEGKKAENAIARLNTAQSDDEFLSSLSELRGVVASGLARKQRAAQNSGVATDQPKANVLDALPKTAAKGARARDTETGDILTFNGFSWVKAK